MNKGIYQGETRKRGSASTIVPEVTVEGYHFRTEKGFFVINLTLLFRPRTSYGINSAVCLQLYGRGEWSSATLLGLCVILFWNNCWSIHEPSNQPRPSNDAKEDVQPLPLLVGQRSRASLGFMLSRMHS